MVRQLDRITWKLLAKRSFATHVRDAEEGKEAGADAPPLAQKPDPLGSTASYKKYNVVRKQPMSFSSSHQRILLIDGEYIHIMPGETGKTLFDTGAKTTTIPYSSVVGCKVSRRHQRLSG
jgi:hypothetical protein